MRENYLDFTRTLFGHDELKDRPEALQGIRVLDLSHMIYGPTAARILAQ